MNRRHFFAAIASTALASLASRTGLAKTALPKLPVAPTIDAWPDTYGEMAKAASGTPYKSARMALVTYVEIKVDGRIEYELEVLNESDAGALTLSKVGARTTIDIITQERYLQLGDMVRVGDDLDLLCNPDRREDGD